MLALLSGKRWLSGNGIGMKITLVAFQTHSDDEDGVSDDSHSGKNP